MVRQTHTRRARLDQPMAPKLSGSAAARRRGRPETAEEALAGRPDLAGQALEELKQKQRQLKQETKRCRVELKNKKRQKKRALQKCQNLDTADLVQVIIDRGIELRALTNAAAAAGSPGAGSSGSSAAPSPAAGVQASAPPAALGTTATLVSELLLAPAVAASPSAMRATGSSPAASEA